MAQKLWEKSVQVNQEIERFTVGRDREMDIYLAKHDVLGSMAHITMLESIGLLQKEELAQLLAELKQIYALAERGEFFIEEGVEDVHSQVELMLTRKLGNVGKKIHSGRSRNDQVLLDLKLFTRTQIKEIAEETEELFHVLIAQSERYKDVLMPGYTHLQIAMPSSFGLWFGSYAESLVDDMLFLQAAFKMCNRNPLGSAAGYGVPLPIDRQLTSDLLAFERPHHNVFYASCARGKDEAVLLAACSQVMLSLSRLAEDLILFSMPEFRYFTLPRDLCTGSSIMPQKYNPDVLELIRAKAALLIGQATSANVILKALPGGYNRDLQDTKELYMEGLRVTRASLRIMRLMAENLTVNPDACRAAFAEPGVFATDRALELVAGGMPFRDAYHQVRDHLEDLRGMDPDVVIAQKTHLGGTNGLDFTLLRGRADALANQAQAAQAKVDAAFAALMDV